MLPQYIYDLSGTVPHPCDCLGVLDDFESCNVLACQMYRDCYGAQCKPFELLRPSSFHELDIAITGLGALTTYTDFMLLCYVYNEDLASSICICDSFIHVPVYVPWEVHPVEIAWLKENFSLY